MFLRTFLLSKIYQELADAMCSAREYVSKVSQTVKLLIKYNIKRGSHINLGWFSCGSSFLVELEFGEDGFCKGRKTGEPGEKHLGQAKTNNKLNPAWT